MRIRKILLILICSVALVLNAAAQDVLPQKPTEAAVADTLNAVARDTVSHEIPDSLPWPRSLQARLDTIVKKAEILKTSQMGLMVYDLTADSVLYAHDAMQTMRPASTMKIITAVTALDRLGADYEYKTQLGYRGEIKVRRDTVWTETLRRNILRRDTLRRDTLRRETLRGETLRGDLLGKDTARTDTVLRIPLTIKRHGVLRGDLYVIGGMDPMISREDLRMFARKVKELGIDTIHGNLYADRSFKDVDSYGEGWCWDDDNAMLSPLVYNRKDNMLEVFRDILNSDGVVFIGDIHEGQRPRDLRHVADVTRPLLTVLKPMMKHSNNLYAESMYYQIGAIQGKPSTARKARAVEETMLIKVGKGDNIHRFADGSGLSLYNYLSADIEVAFLRYAYRHPKKIYEPLYDALPIAGVDGTIKDRMRGTSAYNNVHAKTGTLTGISSLAGYCTAKNGHVLAFAIINQNVMKAVYAKRLQDKICIAITK